MDIPHSRHYFFLGLLLAILALNAAVFYPFLGALIFAATFAALVAPWHGKILLAMPRFPGLASFLTIILVFLMIITPLILLGILVFNQAQDFYIGLAAGESRFGLGEIFEIFTAQFPALELLLPIFNSIDEYAREIVGFLAGNLGSIFSRLASVVLNVFITLIALYFFLKDGRHFRSALLQLSPLDDKDDAMIIDNLGRVVNSVIKGSLLVALLQGVLAGLGYLIFGLPNAALWGAMTTFTALIPGIGTAVILVPAGLYLVSIGHTSAAIGLFIWGFLLVGGIDNLIKPQFIAGAAGLHPFLILMSVLGGLIIFGIYGFLLGPLLLGFLFALLDMYKRGVAPHAHVDSTNIRI